MDQFKQIPMGPLTATNPPHPSSDPVPRVPRPPDTGYDISQWSEFVSLQQVWEEMGLREDTERMGARSLKLRENCHLLLSNILREEQKVLQQLKENVRAFTTEITQTCTQLAVPNPPDLLSDRLSLLQRESSLRKSLDQLRQVRQDREKRQARLQEMETMMCQELGEDPTFSQGLNVAVQDNPHFLIKEEQLLEFRQEVQMLENKLNTHKKKFAALRDKILELWELTSQEPLSDFETRVRDNKAGELTFSSSTLESMQEVHNRLSGVYAEVVKLIDDTRHEVVCLWRRLEIPQEEQDLVSQQTSKKSATTCRILITEKNRLLAIKVENIGKFIQKTRELLQEVWERCYLGPSQRYNMCPVYFSDLPPDEEVLEALEMSLKGMFDQERRFEKLFAVVKKREELWEKYIDLQQKMNDPNRLNNRGGALLKEAKERTSLEKRIPKLEVEIDTLSTEYRSETGLVFAVMDKEYSSHIATQWAERKNTQKSQKAHRQQAKAELIKTEMQYGSTPTPKKVQFKRPRPPTTPKSAKVLEMKQNNGSAKKPCIGSPRKPITHSSLSRTGGKAKNLRRRMSLAKLRRAVVAIEPPSSSSHLTRTLSQKSSPNSTGQGSEKLESLNFPSSSGVFDMNNETYREFSQGIDFKARSSCIPTSLHFK